ncbi:MAG: hypothetical protein WA921_07085 [Ahrensia sp.]
MINRFTSTVVLPVAKPVALVSLVALAGCLGPTYGTDKTAGEQLMEDLGSAMSLRSTETTQINYAPRPDLVQPPNPAILPAPQQSVTEQEGAWIESPEERRARIRAEIDEGNTSARFVGGQDAVDRAGASAGPAQVGAPVTARRNFLTDPPTEYRQPAQTAVIDDVGVSEAKKERALKRAARGQKTGWRRLVPWG